MIEWNEIFSWIEPKTKPSGLKPLQSIQQIQTDSRGDLAGKWFLPLKGELFDGHDFIKDAIKKGAVGIFTDRVLPETPEHVAVIMVDNTLDAYHSLAKGWRKKQTNLQLAAITGSVGKTTTKQMVGSVLSNDGPCLPYEGNFNNEFGVPQTLLKAEPLQNKGVLEIGARRRNDIKTLVKVATPNVVCVLNVGSAHMGVFGGKEQVYKAKLEIYQYAPKDAIFVVNGDDKTICDFVADYPQKKVYFGKSPQSDIRITDTTWKANGMLVSLNCFGSNYELKSDCCHESFPMNAAAALAICHSLGCQVDSSIKELSKFSYSKGRYQVFEKSGLTLIDDSYNANLESMKSGLKTLSKNFSSRNTIVVLGDMLELGEASKEAHMEIGSLCSEKVKPQLLITVGAEARNIASKAVASGYPKDRVLSFGKVEELIEENINFHLFGDTIYAKASNSINLSSFINSL